MTNESVQELAYGNADLDTQELGHDIRAILVPFGEGSDRENDHAPTQDYGIVNNEVPLRPRDQLPPQDRGVNGN